MCGNRKWAHVTEKVRRSEDNFEKLAFSFQLFQIALILLGLHGKPIPSLLEIKSEAQDPINTTGRTGGENESNLARQLLLLQNGAFLGQVSKIQ